MIINRKWAMSSRWTFTIGPIKHLVYKYFDETKLWADPFCGENSPAQVKNDINPSNEKADFHLEALEFLKLQPSDHFDGVLYDPPYSLRQISECYKGHGKELITRGDHWSKVKKEIARITKPNGIVIKFGWDSANIHSTFEIVEILLVPHGGRKNDTICVVCQKKQTSFPF